MNTRANVTHRRIARATVAVVAALAALAIGTAGGFGLSQRYGSVAGSVDTNHNASSDADQLYTCGMHPNVLQKGPGDCPICQMKLTPLRQDDGEGGGESTQRRVLYWRAPMDPNFVSEKPGKSPMGMDLVPVYADAEESRSAHTIRIDPVTIQNMGIRTAVIKRGSLVKTIRTVGRVDYDEQRVTFIDTKFNGWIEGLYVNQTGQRVDKGERLFDVYSPELYAAQQEYISAIQNLPRLEKSTLESVRRDARLMVEAAGVKLKYLDVSEEQIETLRRTETIEKTLAIHAPVGGIVTEKMALKGMYVKPGMRLFTIADLSRVWVYVDVYEYQLPWVRVGQPATMSLPYVPGREFVGKVVYIYPYLEEQTRVIKVRLEFENPEYELKPGMFANIRLNSELQRDAILVPREAYIDSGTRQVVFVDVGSGKFMPRDIKVGVEAEDGMVEVLHGLDAGEVVVTSGQFMLDAESKLKEAVAKMMKAERADTTGRSTAVTKTSPSGYIPEDAQFACPMDKHPDETDPARQGAYFSTGPGRCLWCGMKLKPLDELDWVRVRRAAGGGDLAYTCPDHSHVFSESAGECPRCGRDLAPFRVMYNCSDPDHAGDVSVAPGNCARCGRGMAAFRGVWLDDRMAAANVPDSPGLAEAAPFHCPTHPLVHSDRAGRCTICGVQLESPLQPPAMESTSASLSATYICPMHPATERSADPGTCSICGMRLVIESSLNRLAAAPEHIAAQMGYVTEHYLEIQRLLASDRTAGLTLHALGLAGAAQELSKHIADPGMNLPAEATEAAKTLHAEALKITGTLEADRVTFVELSAAMTTLVEHARPDQARWPKLYHYHCPLSKGDWLQPGETKANPYYGFKMLSCGELKGVK